MLRPSMLVARVPPAVKDISTLFTFDFFLDARERDRHDRGNPITKLPSQH